MPSTTAGSRPGSTTRAATPASRRRILIAAIRNFGVEAAVEIARRHAEDRHPYVVGFNLAGDEAGYPPGAVSRGLRDRRRRRPRLHRPRGRARRRRVGPRGARRCPVTRISHGVRAVEDPALVQEIAERGIVLEVCPTSNVATQRLRLLRGPPTAQSSMKPV